MLHALPKRRGNLARIRTIIVGVALVTGFNIIRETTIHHAPAEVDVAAINNEMLPQTKVNDTTNVYWHSNFLVEFPLCLVHIGKAAGSSVSCGLGLTYADCEGMPRDKLSHTHFFHMRRNNCPPQTRTYLVTVRNPLTRLQSWFDFEKDIIPGRSMQVQQQMKKQREMLFQECFPTFENLVLDGLVPIGNITTRNSKNMSCPERAWAAVLGARTFSYHEWYNYEYYWTGIHPHLNDYATTTNHQNVYALRMEHLSQDWMTVSSEPLFRPVNRRQSKSNTTNMTLHTVLVPNNHVCKILCDALCQEIQYYKQFLIAAENLSPPQKQLSLQELQQYCPLEQSEQHDCPHLPSFPKMKVSKRQYRTEVKKRFFEIA